MARAGPRKVARYGDQFKATAVKLSGLPGVLIQDVVAALDLHPFMLSLWQSATIVHIAEPLVQFRLGRSSNTPETACTCSDRSTLLQRHGQCITERLERQNRCDDSGNGPLRCRRSSTYVLPDREPRRSNRTTYLFRDSARRSMRCGPPSRLVAFLMSASRVCCRKFASRIAMKRLRP